MKRWMSVILPATAVIASLTVLPQSDYFFDDSPHYFGSSLRSWFVGVGAGFEQLFFQDRTDYLVTAPLPPVLADQFTLNNLTGTNGMFSVFVGRQWRPVTNGRINLFLEYDDFTLFSPDGTRFASGYSDPTNALYSPSYYSFSVQHQALLFGTKVDIAEWHQLMPYVEAGIGVSRNTFSNFNNDTVNVPNQEGNQTGAMNAFPNYVNYALAYIFGVGVDVLMQHNWQLSLGYRFGDWGNVQSGNVTSVPAPPGGTLSPICLSNALYSNQAMVRMSYSFAG